MASTAAASAALQTTFDAESQEHAALQGTVRAVRDALEAGGGQSGNSLQSCLTTLYDRVRERLRHSLHTVVKCALAVICSHYSGINREAISEGYVDSEENVVGADDELLKLVEAAEAPGAALVALFEEELVPPLADL
jgi:hypothetical protein